MKKTFTKEELSKIIGDRLSREIKQHGNKSSVEENLLCGYAEACHDIFCDMFKIPLVILDWQDYSKDKVRKISIDKIKKKKKK